MCADTILNSLSPILGWFIISKFLGSELQNVFVLTYPMQFVYIMIVCAFGSAVCIYCNKNNIGNRDDYVKSALLLGMLCSLIIFTIAYIHIDTLCDMMNMNKNTYRIMGRYSLIQLSSQVANGIIINDMYYKGENKKANLISLNFNILNILTVLLLCTVTKREEIVAYGTSGAIAVYIAIVTYIYLRGSEFKLTLKFISGIKYAYPEIISNMIFLTMIGISISKTNDYGAVYITGMALAKLVTDTQWDCLSVLQEVACIDTSKREFKIKEIAKNAILLLIITYTSIGFILLIYGINREITFYTLTLVFWDLVGMAMYCIYSILGSNLKVRGHIKFIVSIKLVGNLSRLAISILITSPYLIPYGILVSCGLQSILCITYSIIKRKEGFNGNKQLGDKGIALID